MDKKLSARICVNLFMKEKVVTVSDADSLPLFTKGDWPTLSPGKNLIKVSGSFSKIKLWRRSVYL
ncbi:hypothetical protein ACH0UL_002385 [Enterococcus hirae]